MILNSPNRRPAGLRRRPWCVVHHGRGNGHRRTHLRYCSRPRHFVHQQHERNRTAHVLPALPGKKNLRIGRSLVRIKVRRREQLIRQVGEGLQASQGDLGCPAPQHIRLGHDEAVRSVGRVDHTIPANINPVHVHANPGQQVSLDDRGNNHPLPRIQRVGIARNRHKDVGAGVNRKPSLRKRIKYNAWVVQNPWRNPQARPELRLGFLVQDASRGFVPDNKIRPNKIDDMIGSHCARRIRVILVARARCSIVGVQDLYR